jgi:ribonuclease HI
LEIPGVSEPVCGSGGIPRTTNNRAELTAVIQGLEQTPEGATVRVVSDSNYVVNGINRGLTKWKSQGWRTGTKKHKRPLQNLDLWLCLDGLRQSRHVTAEWVRGHAGHTRNEECDALASRAMVSAPSS